MESNRKAYGALAVICFFWGTTYLALRVGVADFPPFLFSGIRQFSAGALLFLWMAITGKLEKMSAQDIARQALPGFLLITLGNGLIGWAEKFIPSGLAALIVSVMPIYVLLLNFFSGRERSALNWRTGFGFLLGCTGIVLIFRDNLQDLANPDYLMGILVSFSACLFWAIGSLYIKRSTFRTGAYTNAALQFTSGGIGCLVFAAFFDDWSQIGNTGWSSMGALVYLILIGSILCYLCYLYAIQNLPILVVSTYAYVNPVIAILLGVALLDERITWLTVLALVVTLYGVYLINTGLRKDYFKK